VRSADRVGEADGVAQLPDPELGCGGLGVDGARCDVGDLSGGRYGVPAMQTMTTSVRSGTPRAGMGPRRPRSTSSAPAVAPWARRSSSPSSSRPPRRTAPGSGRAATVNSRTPHPSGRAAGPPFPGGLCRCAACRLPAGGAGPCRGAGTWQHSPRRM